MALGCGTRLPTSLSYLLPPKTLPNQKPTKVLKRSMDYNPHSSCAKWWPSPRKASSAAIGARVQDGYSLIQIILMAGRRIVLRALSMRAPLLTGTNIFFRSGAYQPATLDGLHTLAHEVTHVAQQTRGSSGGNTYFGDGLSINDTGDQFEQEAQASADRFSMTTLVQQQITDGFGYSTHSPSSPPLAASQPPSFRGITVK